MHKKRFHHVVASHTCDERVGYLLRLSRGYGIDPHITRGSGAIVIIEQLGTVRRERSRRSAQVIDTLGKRKRSSATTREIVKKNVGVAVDVSGPRDGLTIRG